MFKTILTCHVLALLALAAPGARAGDTGMPGMQATPDAIQSAMRAAPQKVSARATIATMDEHGQLHTLRAGRNGFVCLPDNAFTPGPDPMCLDRAALDWMNALMTHKPPARDKTGFMYMLAGGTDASNTDPYATRPTARNHWIKTGPHVMIVGADAAFYDQYPKHADPDTAVPYVMWPGTPYQHLMIPVR